MKVNRRICVLAITGLCCAVLSFFGVKVLAQSQTTSQQNRDHFKVLDDAARQAVPEDENSIRVLANAVFDAPHVYPHLPADIESVAKNQLVQAEKAYMQKSGPGIQEQAVVNAINTLADKLALPDYAKTSALQVRVTRMRGAVGAPIFMGKGMTQPGAKIGDTISAEMSPLQAAYLTAVIIDQKFINPEYQMPPNEWDQGFQALSQTSGAPKTAGIEAGVNHKRRELDNAVVKGFSSLSASDASDLIEQTFSNLGIGGVR